MEGRTFGFERLHRVRVGGGICLPSSKGHVTWHSSISTFSNVIFLGNLFPPRLVRAVCALCLPLSK